MPRFSAVVLASMLTVASSVGAVTTNDAATPPEMVQTYDRLADAILGLKEAEHAMVRSILAGTYQHAEGVITRIERGGGDMAAKMEMLADLVAQLGNEGDAAVAAIRKRLIEGGHHHNAKGEEQGIYDEGFVIVTRKARKVFLDASGRIARLGSSPDMAALKAEWKIVSEQYDALFE